MASKSLIADVFKPVDLDIQNAGHSEYWLKGGRGSTKSSFISVEIIVGMLEDDEANAIIYRRVGNTVKDSVYAQMIWAIETLGCSEVFQYKVSPLEIVRKKTGQRIMFRGADDPMKSKSIKLTKGYFKYLWFEELAEFRSMEDIRTIKQSVFRNVDTAFTFYSYNPPRSAQSWVNAEALIDNPSRLVHTSSYLDVPENWLGKSFIQQADILKETNDRAYRNEYLGEVTGNGGNVFENLEIREITDEEIGTMGYFYQGVDWGWFPDPFQWVRCSFDSRKRILYLIDECRAHKTGNRDSYELVRERLRKDESLIADSAEPKSIADWREFGAWWIRGVVKGAGSVEYSTKWLGALTKIVIDPKRCPNCAKEFSMYEYERNHDGEFISGYVDKDNHCIDATRYAMFPVWRLKGI